MSNLVPVITSAIDGKQLRIIDQEVKLVRMPTFKEKTLYPRVQGVVEMKDGVVHFTVHNQGFLEKALEIGEQL